jgi:hypothetical protein
MGKATFSVLEGHALPGGTGDLNKNNLNLKRFQKINHRRNYFKKITSFCFAILGGEAAEGASPQAVAKQRCASPLTVAKQVSLRRHS